MSQVDPSLVDILGAFLLAGACGGLGATAGAAVVGRWFDWTPTSPVRAAALGVAVGAWYPASWVVALSALSRASVPVDGSPTGGGLPAAVAAVGLGGVLWAGLWVAERSQSERGPVLGTTALVVSFVVVLSVGFATLLPLLLPVLLP